MALNLLQVLEDGRLKGLWDGVTGPFVSLDTPRPATHTVTEVTYE
jgi:hypothetical protein